MILLECISGSRAYGLATETSDTDIRGVFIMPKKDYYGLSYFPQINNESQDVVFYELKRFIELLSRNNPNMLELIAVPEEAIIYKNPLMDKLKPEIFLSKQCKNTFAGYAISQVKKAKGLKKKIVNPVEKERKTVLDFCYVTYRQGSIPIREWLQMNGLKQEHCGLAKIPHMHDMYGLYYDEMKNYRGIIQKELANDVSLSSISKGLDPIAIMSFNKSGYSSYCNEYKEYWEWVEKRNEERYKNTMEHGKDYDAKNMMHTFRLLKMAEEIGKEKKIKVKREDREFLLDIKQGKFKYEELVKKAEEKIIGIEQIFKKSDLPDHPDLEKINRLLIDIRNKFYENYPN